MSTFRFANWATVRSTPFGFRTPDVPTSILLALEICIGMLFVSDLSPGQAQTFTDVTSIAGLDYAQVGNPTSWPLEVITGGAAAGDYDNDGWVDLFVTRLGAPDILFRNTGGSFANVSAAAFATPPPGSSSDDSNGAAWGDVDNDGDLDLYVTKVTGTRHYLYINNGNGTFTEEALGRGAAIENAGTHRGSGIAFGDYDLDGNLDVYIAEWRDPTTDEVNARLLRNTGAGNFEDKTLDAGVEIGNPDGSVRGFSPRFSDLNRDGLPDLVIAADFGESRLFWNNGDGTFQDGTVAPLGADQNGMGSAVGDFNGDGHLDWLVTSIYNGTTKIGNRLYQNNGNGDENNPPTFTDVSDAVGVADGGWGWGAEMFDYDNDGDNDIVHVNGFFPGSYQFDQTRLFRNDSGTFQEVATVEGITDTDQGRGLLTFDYDKDGDLDIFIANYGYDGPVLYRNDSIQSNDWLQIETTGTLSNSDGIGAWITVIPDNEAYDPLNPIPGTFQVHEQDGGSNYLAQSEMLAHFGLGDLPEGALVDQVQIVWPSGIVQDFYDVKPNARYLVDESLGLFALEVPGDYDGDLDVDGFDFLKWQRDLGQSVAMPGDGADGNGNGIIDDGDFEVWGTHFGMTSGSVVGGLSVAVPEPTSLLLLLAGLSTLAPGCRLLGPNSGEMGRKTPIETKHKVSRSGEI